MDHATQVSILKDLFRQLDSGHNIDAGMQMLNPTRVYTDRDIAAREWQHLFRNHPQVIGLSCELGETGNYMTADDFGVPVVATRGADGKARAFINACRHRGARVAPEKRGVGKRFTCPFHAWTYDTDGTLLKVPREHDFGEVDKSCFGLVELPLAEMGGLLWIHPDPAGTLDGSTLPGPLETELLGLGLGTMQFQCESALDMPLNWKLANDTFGETYHFSRLHRSTLGQLFYGNVQGYEAFGRNHRFVIASRNIDELRDRPESQWHILEGAMVLYYLFPNIQLTINRVGANLIRIYPDADNPGRSISRVSHFLRPEVLHALSLADKPAVDASNAYDLEARRSSNAVAPQASMEIFRSTIEHEDYAMGVDIQQAAESGRLQHLIFGRNEPALHHFHSCFSEALGLPMPTVLQPATASARAQSG